MADSSIPPTPPPPPTASVADDISHGLGVSLANPKLPAVAPPADLSLEPVSDQLFKADDRSTVWRTAEGDWVVKRFEHHRLRQVLGWCIGLHPAQMEGWKARCMWKRGLPVVPVAKVMMRGGRGYVVTGHAGRCVTFVIQDGILSDHKAGRELLKCVGEVFVELIKEGYYFRDLQIGNLVWVEGQGVYLIDVGSAKRLYSYRQFSRMLELLTHSVYKQGAQAEDVRGMLEHIQGRLEKADGVLKWRDSIQRWMQEYPNGTP